MIFLMLATWKIVQRSADCVSRTDSAWEVARATKLVRAFPDLRKMEWLLSYYDYYLFAREKLRRPPAAKRERAAVLLECVNKVLRSSNLYFVPDIDWDLESDEEQQYSEALMLCDAIFDDGLPSGVRPPADVVSRMKAAARDMKLRVDSLPIRALVGSPRYDIEI